MRRKDQSGEGKDNKYGNSSAEAFNIGQFSLQ